MKTRHLSFLIIMGLPSLAIPIGDRTNAEAGQDCRTLERAKELIGRSDPKAVQKNTGNDLQAVKKALEEVSQQLRIPKEIPQGDVEKFKQHVRELGFEPDKEMNIQKAEEYLEKAFPIFEVNLNDLRDFGPGKNVNNLLSDTCQLLIPIQVDKKMASDKEGKSSVTSITIRFIPDIQDKERQKGNAPGWRLTRWGLPKLTRQLTEQKLQKEKIPGLKDFRLVSVPSLNRNFLGYEENNVVQLVPLFKNKHLTVGEPYPAQKVFKTLSLEAKSMNNYPR